MQQLSIEAVVKNVNERFARVEQILPALPTKVDVEAAVAVGVAPLATKVELAAAIGEAVAPLATKVELAAAIGEAVAPLATKVEMRDEGERSRTHFDAVAERLEGQIRLVAEGQVALQERVDDGLQQVATKIARLDRRVMRVEAARRP